MEPEERFAKIEALLQEMTEREKQTDLRFNQRMDRAEERSEKFDRQLQATRKLVETGMKVVVRMDQRHKAFLDSLKKGGNGSRRVA